MDARTLSTIQSLGRIGIGAVLALAPEQIAPRWVGDDGDRPGARVIATGFGARDVGIGAGQLLATRAGHGARPWLWAAFLGDVADFAATMRHRDRLPGLAVAGVAAMASSSALLALWLARELD